MMSVRERLVGQPRPAVHSHYAEFASQLVEECGQPGFHVARIPRAELRPCWRDDDGASYAGRPGPAQQVPVSLHMGSFPSDRLQLRLVLLSHPVQSLADHRLGYGLPWAPAAGLADVAPVLDD